jgi:heme/copper-type cytochrome/quinol oxidase subunit 1
LPDYGEFGRFERLLYAAYVWLVLGVIFEILAGAAVIYGYSFLQSNDAARHMLFMGFITQLILGMAVRMIPGFIGRKAIASARLVDAAFWLANAATVFRVLPLILPLEMFEAMPMAVDVAQATFAFSGILGMAAVGCLAVNLWKTR